MYGESSFTWEYVCGYATREQRKRRLARRAYTLGAAVCIVSLTVMLSAKLVAAGGVRYLKEKLWNAEEAAELPMDGKVTEAVQAQEMALPVAVALAQAAATAGDEDGLSAAAHIPTVYLDPGHGGTDEGCARAGVREKDLNLAIALLVREQLQGQGYQVIMSRETDTYIAKEARVAEANRSGADIYISIHQNATEEGAGVKGMEVWYTEDEERTDSRRLAQLIRQQTLKSTEAAERELRGDADFYVTKNTSMPACLIETGFLSNAAERRKLNLAEYQQQIADGIVQGVLYYFHPKTMYLTFDDGPSEENTRKVLEILRERNIKATFFLVGENVRQHPEVARQIVEEGHTIGIHCNRHVYDEIYESVEAYLADFQEAYDAVYEVTGAEVKLFRFPGGSINAYNKEVYEDIIAEMTERGFVYFDWNGSLEDAVSKSTPEQLVRNAVESTLGRKKVVMLAHDIVSNTVSCLEQLIDSFPEYKMEPLTEEVKPIQF